MPSVSPPLPSNSPVILVVEEEVLVRLSLAEFLRACGFWVQEAASTEEAQSILVADDRVDIVIADAQLAGATDGFALAQWIRRRRPKLQLILAVGVPGKARAAAELCDQHARRPKVCEHVHLADRINAMLARRARRSKGARATWVHVARARRC